MNQVYGNHICNQLLFFGSPHNLQNFYHIGNSMQLSVAAMTRRAIDNDDAVIKATGSAKAVSTLKMVPKSRAAVLPPSSGAARQSATKTTVSVFEGMWNLWMKQCGCC